MTQILEGALQGDPLEELAGEVIDTFLGRRCRAGWLPKGSRVYRYGSTSSQAQWSRGPWVNVSEDCFEYADEAIEGCALLDATFHTLEFDPTRRKGAIWNTAAWRATLIVKTDVPVYFGRVGPLGFDLWTGKRYRGPGDQTPHRSYPGGASQLLIRGTDFDKMQWVPPMKMRWTRRLV